MSKKKWNLQAYGETVSPASMRGIWIPAHVQLANVKLKAWRQNQVPSAVPASMLDGLRSAGQKNEKKMRAKNGPQVTL